MGVPLTYSFAVLQVLGLFLVAISIVMISKREYYSKIIQDLKANNPLILFAATLGLLVGIILVYMHNIWGLHHRTLVTVFVWFIFMTSLFWLMMPEVMLRLTQRTLSSLLGFYFFFGFLFFFGFAMLGRGTFMFITHNLSLALLG